MTQKSIGIVCLSAIPDDPRVRRQGDLFHDAGYDVHAFGLPDFRSPEPRWSYHVIDAPVEIVTTGEAGAPSTNTSIISPMTGNAAAAPAVRARGQSELLLRKTARGTFHRLKRVLDLARTFLNPAAALKAYWSLNDKFEKLYQIASRQKVDIWLANDWTTLPIVMRLAREQGVPFIYDTHELAVDEYAQSLKWRLTQRPIIRGVERAGIHAARATTCVSAGIADRLKEVHGLLERPRIVRNTPVYTQADFRPTGKSIHVLYHGIVSPGRALEEAIASVSLWRPEFTLSIRGPASDAYLGQLRALAATCGVSDRVSFLPPVAMTDLVASAKTFDVGFFAIRGHSLQNTYVLPNKFFEYTMAGLALCVSDLPEMRNLIEQYGMGTLIQSVEKGAIADAINALTAQDIDRLKKRALEAAKQLSWETESRFFIETAEKAVAGHR